MLLYSFYFSSQTSLGVLCTGMEASFKERYNFVGEGAALSNYRLVFGFEKLTYKKRLNRLDLATLEDRRLRRDLII